MPYILITDFKAGLDVRRLPEAATPGSLTTLINAHINRGGEIEKRLSFVSKYTIPTGTFGLQATTSALYVFGSGTDPGVPSGLTYQRLQHPDALAMSSITHSEVFGGKIYAIAKYSDGTEYAFFDGALVTDWLDGIVRSTDTDNDGIATALATLVNADPNVTGTSTTNVVTIEGAAGETFSVTSDADNGTGNATDDQTATALKTQTAIAGQPEVLAVGKIQITGGEEPTAATGSIDLTAGASGSVDTITVNSIDILGGSEAFNTDLSTTATNVAATITANTSTPNYNAAAAGAVITITAEKVDGADANALAVDGTSTTITLGNKVNMSGGITRRLQRFLVDGINILSGPVGYTVSNSGTATAIKDNVNNNTSSPNYTAVTDGGTIVISAIAGTGSDPNGHVVEAVFQNDDTETTTETPPVETPVSADPPPEKTEDPFERQVREALEAADFG